MTFFLIGVFVMGMAMGCVSDAITKKKIRKFNMRLTDFEKKFYGEVSEEKIFVDFKDFEYGRLATMPNRLCRLEACFQCPLYQEKAQEDKQKKLQEVQE